MKGQISDSQRKELEKQQYRFVGGHSAVKVCGWTKNKIAGKGSCYKEKFYGIQSHQCMQMTTSMYCANRCKFCWRGMKAPVSETWYGGVDEPNEIIDGAIRNHVKLLQGFRGLPKADKKIIEEMEDVRHVALSLTGESLVYPKFNELLNEFAKRGISTFVVTNGQFPDDLDKVRDVTQMYLSVDAPDKMTLKKIGNPLFSDYWERLMKSLDVLSTRKYRTAIRLTLIRGENMFDVEGYANLIRRGRPCFVEVKGYMWVGESQKQYKHEDMPSSKEIRDFAEKLVKELDYEVVDEHLPSRVVLLVRKDMIGKEMIDFSK